MIRINSNVKSVIGALKRVELKFQPGIVARLKRLDYLATAFGVLDALMTDSERRFLPFMIRGIAIVGIDIGFGVTIGVPPNLVERARMVARAERYPGRPGKDGERVQFAEFKEDLSALRELVRLWVETPATSADDPGSGKIRDERDAGLSDEEIVDRLQWILGLSGARSGMMIDSFQTGRGRRKPLSQARASLTGALERFYQATFGEASGMSPARVEALIKAVQAAWVELIAVSLPDAAAESLRRAMAIA
jgi:hypothetical protein